MIINCAFNGGVEISGHQFASNFWVFGNFLLCLLFLMLRFLIGFIVLFIAIHTCIATNYIGPRRSFQIDYIFSESVMSNVNWVILIIRSIFGIVTWVLLMVLYFNIASSYYCTSASVNFFITLLICFIISLIIGSLMFDAVNNDLIKELIYIFYLPMFIMLFLLFTLILSRFYNTKVQFICNFLYSDLQIVAIRLLELYNNFIEFYTYDGHNINKVSDIQKNGVTIKITSTDGNVNIEFFQNGVKVNEIKSWKVCVENSRSGMDRSTITPNDIIIYHNRDEYGSLTISEIYQWFVSLFSKTK